MHINVILLMLVYLVATPGRLNDLVEAKVIDVCTITFLILDEGKGNTLAFELRSTLVFVNQKIQA